jgi:glycosyltransferase involved in cell wall biosynthesis
VKTGRVLIVEGAGNLWGSERVLLDMLPNLSGIDVAVCCPPRTLIVERLLRLHVRVFATFVERLHEKSRLMRLIALVGLVRACIAYRPDLIYLNQTGCYRIARSAARWLRIPIVVHVRIFEDVEYLARRKPSSRQLRGVVAVSSAISKEIRKFGVLRKLRVDTIYDGYARQAGSPICERNGEERQPGCIACVGRIAPIKGQDLLLEAIAILRAQGKGVRCLMIGSGEEFWDQLKKKSAAQGMGKVIEWLGFQHDPLRILRASRVVVVPSHREPLGRVIFEAWDAGCVPVAFRGSGGAAEVLEASRGGILYDDQTANSLAVAIEAVLALSDEELARLVTRGREWMAIHCSAVQYAALMREVFARAISGRVTSDLC